jgi:WD40 repeat protein/serine/threonine protein kinase
MPDKIKDPILGRTLGDFLVKEKLGEGGFGAVYKATQLTLAREVVIKILHAKHRSSQELIERFKREAHLASRLEHPYCAHIYSFGAESDGLLWIAMEYVKGTPLSELLKNQGTVPLEKFVPLLDKICEVVHTAHEKGIIHRDLKPANVMVISRAGRLLPKLLDFGIAKSFDSPNPKLNKGLHLSDSTSVKTNLIEKDRLVSLLEDTTIKAETPNAKSEKKEPQTVSDKINEASQTHTDPLRDQKDLPKTNTQKIELEETDGKENTFQTEGIMGSPRYMSPEQWEGAAKADARSDIYALGVIAYECLTGIPPFTESAFPALMKAHLLKNVPSLGKNFPSVLDTVISKAMAKDPLERYKSALDFAVAFRSMAGFDQEPQLIPKLNQELQEELITCAPRPIAEAVASLASARNLHQSKDLIGKVLQILLRYLALLALATYPRIKNEKIPLTVSELVFQLYKQGLSEKEWLDLASELVRPFVKNPDVYPIPELVRFFFDSGEEKVKQDIKQLLELKESLSLTSLVKEDDLLSQLERFVFLLSNLLKKASWIMSYQLVIAKDRETIEKLMGAIRQNYFLSVKTKKLPPNQVVLIDSTGNLVVILEPLIEFLAPSLSSACEVFFLERSARRGAKLISWPKGFEYQSEAPWEWAREYFFAAKEKEKISILEEKSPYLGLVAFSPNDASLFFGRERETESFLNRLRIESLLAVVGASGAGKSSFIQAGVIPGLGENWKSVTLRPGNSPINTLSKKLSALGVEFTDLKSDLQKDIKFLGKKLREFAIEQKINILLVIDQFEELITLCLNKEEQQLYVDALVSATQFEDEPIRIILTMRDDFLVRVKELTTLRERLSKAIEILTTPLPEELFRVLTEPAKERGYDFEDQELPQEIVNSVVGQTSALPLLAFTAAKLWERRDSQFKQLRRSVYESMGGVGGALARHAEEMLQQMTQAEQSLVKDAFYHLVTSQGTRAILTRPEILQLLGKSNDSERVLEKLISSRLLVSAEGEKGIDRIEIVHEALLSAWPRLVRWRQEMAEGVRLRDQLRSAARQWQERAYPKGLLWRDDALTEYKLWRERYQGKLTDLEEDFGKASILESTRNQRLKKRLLVSAVTLLILGAAVLYYQRQQAQSQLIETLKLYEEQGRQEMLKGNLEGAAVYLSEAYAKGADDIALRYMLSTALAKAENRLSITLGTHTDSVTKVAFSPDGELIITASKDKTARIWSVKNGKELAILSGHKDALTFACFSPDGNLALTSSLDKTACIWQVNSGKLLTTLEGHLDAVNKAIFSPSGREILTISYDSTAKLWSQTTGKLIATLKGHQGAIYDACFNSKGDLIATASADKTAMIWNGSNGQLKRTLAAHQSAVTSIAFSPMAKLVATGSSDSTAMIWQTDEGKLVNILSAHQGGITSVKFSPNGKTILTTSIDKNAYIWDAKTAKITLKLVGHSEAIHDGNFSYDGKLILTNSYDKNLRVWESESGKFLVAFAEHQGGISSSAFSRNSEIIASGSNDKTAKIWKLNIEQRTPTKVAEIVKEKIPIQLKDGRLISQKQNNTEQNTSQIPIEKIVDTSSKNLTNLYVEDLGNNIKIEMLKISNGTFQMGSPESELGRTSDEKIHTVKISKDFYIGKYEVTQEQWKAISALPSINILLSGDPFGFKGEKLPAEQISWQEAFEFCARLSKLTGQKYRLPTEAEWEYAAKANNSSLHNNLDDICWYDKNSADKTHIVGQKKPNAWGLYDICGNVTEWCSDWYGDYDLTSVVDPSKDKAGTYKLVRGGHYYSDPNSCRVSYRFSAAQDIRASSIGFRLVMEPKAQ